MSPNRLLPLATLMSLVVMSAPLQAQDALGEWKKIPSGQSGLVLIIESGASIKSVSLLDEKKAVLNLTQWGLPLPFIRQYRMEPGAYLLLGLGEPISDVRVTTKAASLVYMRLGTFRVPDTDGLGVQIFTWGGPTTANIAGLLTEAAAKGLKEAAFFTPYIDVPGKVLQISTEPPWPIPPQRPPPPKQ